MNKPSVLRAAALLSAIAASAGSNALAATLELTSPDVQAGHPIAQTFAYNGFGCTGQNISPALSWRNPPPGTKSFAVTVHDPDAATGGAGFWHWVVVDLPADSSALPKGAGRNAPGSLPTGARQIASDFGVPGWGGPCPPSGERAHRYNFTVYALKVDHLELPTNATASLAGFMINMNSLGKASFTSTYGR